MMLQYSCHVPSQTTPGAGFVHFKTLTIQLLQYFKTIHMLQYFKTIHLLQYFKTIQMLQSARCCIWWWDQSDPAWPHLTTEWITLHPTTVWIPTADHLKAAENQNKPQCVNFPLHLAANTFAPHAWYTGCFFSHWYTSLNSKYKKVNLG